MTINDVRFIQEVGRFKAAHPMAGVRFDACTLIFGENGWGKSTLAEILRSLTLNDPSILIGRKTLGKKGGEQKVVIQIENQPTVFENGAWRGQRPKIVIYDNVFINQNVFSGDDVSANHLKKQHGLIVGETGVQLATQIVTLDDENRKNNDLIKQIESELGIAIRTTSGNTPDLDTFLGMPGQPDIENRIASKLAQISQVQRAKEIQAAAELQAFPLPTETTFFIDLLIRDVGQVAETALRAVRDHIDAHDLETDTLSKTHESWLEEGVHFVKTDDCPFCGQLLKDKNLIEAFGDFFSDAYKSLAKDLAQARDRLKRYEQEDFREAVSSIFERNKKQLSFWEEVGQLKSPEIDHPISIIAHMEDAAGKLDAVFQQKQANLTEPIEDQECQEVLRIWTEGHEMVSQMNNVANKFNEKIKAFKQTLDPSTLAVLEKDLTSLKLTKLRYTEEIKNKIDDLRARKLRKRDISKHKAELRRKLTEHGQSITKELGAKINAYLDDLHAGFRISYQEPNYQSKEPSANYEILINDVPVQPRDMQKEEATPCFRNTLSAGDKSLLALALFLAKINSDDDIKDKIVVFDDPFTSLDSFRRQFTAFEIKKVISVADQTIILSHDKNFLRLLWDKLDQSQISSLAIQNGAPGSATLSLYSLESETQPRHVTEREKLQSYIGGESHDPSHVRTRLRTVCEHFYRSGDPGMFAANDNLDAIIRKLRMASADYPYKSAVSELELINEYSRPDCHAEFPASSSEGTSEEELKGMCGRVIRLTAGL